MGKRRNREGTIYDSPKGSGIWWVQLPAGPDGRRIKRKVKPGEDPVLVKRQLEAERDAGRDLSRKAGTVAELVAAHLATLEDVVSGSTMHSKRYRAKHITDRIGAMKIDQVEPETVQRLINQLNRTLGAEYVRQIVQLLHAAYEIAVPERVGRNPVDWRKLQLRKVRRPDRHPLPDDQVRILLVAADDLERQGGEARYAVAWWLAALLGMRRGEIEALTWRDVDLERATIKVRQTLAPDGHGGYAIGPTKNRQSRVLPVPPRLLARLKAHWEAQQAERRYYGTRRKEHGFLVCDEAGNAMPNATRLNHLLTRLCERAGLPKINPHLLRHGCATLLAEEGYGEALIASILGHDGGRTITRAYIHPTEKARRAAVEGLEARIFGATAQAAREAL